MAVNLNKHEKKKVNLSKEKQNTGTKVKHSKTSSEKSNGVSNYVHPRGESDSTFNDITQERFKTQKKGSRFKLWFLIPIVAVALICFIAVIIHSSSNLSGDGFDLKDSSLEPTENVSENEKYTDNLNVDEKMYSEEEELNSENEDSFDIEDAEGVGDSPDDPNAVVGGYVDDATLHNYEIITADVTWEEAFEDCIRRGGYLCRINSEAENNEIKSILNDKNVKGVVYLGGIRDESSNEYHWIDSERRAFDEVINSDDYVKYWYSGEPSFSDVVDDKEIPECYMSIIYPKAVDDWVWNDVSNDVLSLAPNYYSGRLSYICEFE